MSRAGGCERIETEVDAMETQVTLLVKAERVLFEPINGDHVARDLVRVSPPTSDGKQFVYVGPRFVGELIDVAWAGKHWDVLVRPTGYEA